MTGRPADLLETIVAATRTRVAACRDLVPEAALEARVASQAVTRDFRSALSRSGVSVIAECKRRSPSKGLLRADYDPVGIARSYEQAGAAAISVLTEPTFFDGALSHLEAVRAAVEIPLLRKDFMVDRYQLLEARAAGADAILLIVAALDDERLMTLRREAESLGLDALVEVHDEAELDRAIAAGADVIGVNSRNLRTLEVDLEASDRLAARIPTHVVAVAESGLRSREDIDRLAARGYRAFLVGERLMTAADPGAALGAMTGRGVSA
jgi:indole-3-glycerol phosphate synthase